MCHPPPRAIRGARMRENRSVHNCFFSVLPLCTASKLDPDPKHLASKKHDMTRHSMCFFQGQFLLPEKHVGVCFPSLGCFHNNGCLSSEVNRIAREFHSAQEGF